MNEYVIYDELGQGACGTIYLVKRRDSMFAIKSIKKSIKYKFRAIIEQQILNDMDHPFVSKLYASFQNDNALYLVLDYYEIGDLFQLANQTTLDEDHVLYYSSCVILAIEYLHSQGVIHRDLKPENILVRSNGLIAVADFDLSVYCRSSVNIKQFTTEYSQTIKTVVQPSYKLDSYCGTLEYLAPEIILGKDHSCIVDWWAFGILIYELLFNKTPFVDRNDHKTKNNIKMAVLNIPDCSDNVKNLLKKLLKRKTGKRISVNGANAIKDHPFYKNVDFERIYDLVPPITKKPEKYMIRRNLEFVGDNNDVWTEFKDIDKF